MQSSLTVEVLRRRVVPSSPSSVSLDIDVELRLVGDPSSVTIRLPRRPDRSFRLQPGTTHAHLLLSSLPESGSLSVRFETSASLFVQRPLPPFVTLEGSDFIFTFDPRDPSLRGMTFAPEPFVDVVESPGYAQQTGDVYPFNPYQTMSVQASHGIRGFEPRRFFSPK